MLGTGQTDWDELNDKIASKKKGKKAKVMNRDVTEDGWVDEDMEVIGEEVKAVDLGRDPDGMHVGDAANNDVNELDVEDKIT